MAATSFRSRRPEVEKLNELNRPQIIIAAVAGLLLAGPTPPSVMMSAAA